jgi:hypothetical protein
VGTPCYLACFTNWLNGAFCRTKLLSYGMQLLTDLNDGDSPSAEELRWIQETTYKRVRKPFWLSIKSAPPLTLYSSVVFERCELRAAGRALELFTNTQDISPSPIFSTVNEPKVPVNTTCIYMDSVPRMPHPLPAFVLLAWAQRTQRT